MGKDWRDNKFGREADYSALNEGEDLAFFFKGWGLIAVIVAAAVFVAVGLLRWVF